MQRIEYCRHKAATLEGAMDFSSPKARREIAAMADQWRSCAAQLQLLDEVSSQPRYRRGGEFDPTQTGSGAERSLRPPELDGACNDEL